MRVFLSVCLFQLVAIATQAQKPERIEITGNKFTYFLFSDTVRRVDVGTDQIHADYDVSSVKITPLMADFPETSLFVMMTNGNYKYYIVNYSEAPKKLVYDYRREQPQLQKPNQPDQKPDSHFQFSNFHNIAPTTRETVIANAKRVLNTEPDIYDVAINKSKVLTKLDNVAYDGTYIYLKFNIEISANIDYHHDFCKFFVINKKSIRKKGLQEEEQLPIMEFHETDTVRKDEIMPLIFAFEKFTITDHKRLRAEFWESQGDRKTELFIDNHEILNALKL